VDQTLAFEIGAVFFLVVLFMAGTKVGSVFPKLGKNIKYVLIAGVVCVIALGALRMWPQAYGALSSIVDFSSDSPPTRATPSQDNPAAPAKVTLPKRVNPASGKATEVEYLIQAAPQPAIVPEKVEAKSEATLAEPPALSEKKNRGKHVIKSIGRALHFGRKDDRHPQ
jgi:hypothetical protein